MKFASPNVRARRRSPQQGPARSESEDRSSPRTRPSESRTRGGTNHFSQVLRKISENWPPSVKRVRCLKDRQTLKKSLPLVLQAEMTERASCWSITINNYTQGDISPDLPPGWKFQGQPEVGKEGTEHFQGMLTTPQVRFSAVKKVFPRAHIEVARNRAALAKYVKKEETRNGEYTVVNSTIPTLFEYQGVVAKKFEMKILSERYQEKLKAWIAEEARQAPDMDEMAMEYLDELVAQDIENGMRGVEFIAINPMWRSSWKKFWRSIIKRNAQSPEVEAPSAQRQEDDASSSSGESPRVRNDEGDAHV